MAVIMHFIRSDRVAYYVWCHAMKVIHCVHRDIVKYVYVRTGLYDEGHCVM